MFRRSTLYALCSIFQAALVARAFVVTTSGGRRLPLVSAPAIGTTKTTIPPCARQDSSWTTTTVLSAEEDGARDTAAEEDTTTAASAGNSSSSSSSSSSNDGDASGNDILNSPAFLKRKLEVLKTDVTKAEEDLAEAEKNLEVAKAEWGPQLDDLQREYSNIQERMSSQNQQGDAQAIMTVVKAVLELLDNFDRAYGVIKPETEADEAVQAEYKAAYQQILDTFGKLGIKEVETMGTEFDYELHQAVMQMPGSEYDEGIVCQEFQKGFVMGEEESLTLIRPAMVAVAQ